VRFLFYACSRTFDTILVKNLLHTEANDKEGLRPGLARALPAPVPPKLFALGTQRCARMTAVVSCREIRSGVSAYGRVNRDDRIGTEGIVEAL